MLRRRLYRIALMANAILLVLGATSIRLGATDAPSSQLESKQPGAVSIQHSGPLPAPLQVGSAQLAPAPPPAAAAPQPLPVVVPPAPVDQVGKIKADILAAMGASTAQTAGVAVEIDGLGRIYESNPNQLLPPASAQKLRTAGVALLKLGPNFRFRTEVLAKGDMTPEGVFRGDLVLAGGGDPALGRAELAALAAAVHGAGIRVVEGTLWGDESRYDNIRTGPAWKSDFVTHESGTLSALAVDQNEYRDDSGFVIDPVTANVDLFREALTGAGIAVNGPTRVGRPEGELRLLTGHYSPPLAALIAVMMKESDNFFAELLMKELGRTIGKPTTLGGAEVVGATLRSLGVSPGEVHDGSGLSPLNRQSAENELSWLKIIEKSTIGEMFRSSLAVSCSAPGTLKKRFCGSSAAGQVFGKTGALPGSTVLVGYTTTATGRAVRFSFVLAGTHSNRQARDAIDRAVMALKDFQG